MEKVQNIDFLLLREYLDEYSGIFNEREERELFKWIKYVNAGYMLPDFVREVFDELGLFSDDKNIYLGFIEMADAAFDLKNRHILEIGGGILPRLGERISAFQDKGSITVYDERISKYKESTEKMKLVRKNFDKSMEIRNIDLLIGLMPCKAAELIIELAAKNNIDFMIALCEGGPHGDEFDFYEDEEEWQHSVIYSARCAVRDKEMGKLLIKDMEKYGNPYPIIYNERNF